MQCESCGAPLTEVKCLYCGRKSAEFLAQEETQSQVIEQPRYEEPHFIDRERAEASPETDDHEQIRKRAIIKFVLCLFLGLFGVHYFYEKKFVMGLLYLFTRGLFWIGWIFDCIRLFINMVKILSN